MKVLDKIKTRDRTVLICELFNDDVVTDRLKTNIGILNYDEFKVEQPRGCFSKPKASMIILKGNIDTSKIEEIDFIN